ncbi:hypothetical protein PPSQR21_038500 [Paenibacillus polymyxa SQR-21]|nr:hypothetical protein PPSQR21_038500 [Paenibacillus polymyxa SQR-21]
MQCPRCNVPTVRIHFPSGTLFSPRGVQLPSSVERCPKCLLEFRDVPKDFSIPERFDPAIDAAPLPEPPISDENRTFNSSRIVWPDSKPERSIASGSDQAYQNTNDDGLEQLSFSFDQVVGGFK